MRWPSIANGLILGRDPPLWTDACRGIFCHATCEHQRCLASLLQCRGVTLHPPSPFLPILLHEMAPDLTRLAACSARPLHLTIFFSPPGSRMRLAVACSLRSHKCDIRFHNRASTWAVEACMHFGVGLLGFERAATCSAAVSYRFRRCAFALQLFGAHC